MKEQELMKKADAKTKVEDARETNLKTEVETFSKKEEKLCPDNKSVKDALKAKLNLKKVEGLFGDIAVVSDEHYRMGVVTLDGEIIVPFGKYGWIGSFREDGTAPVRNGKRSSSKKDAKWGSIDKHGEEVVPLHYKKNNQNNE